VFRHRLCYRGVVREPLCFARSYKGAIVRLFLAGSSLCNHGVIDEGSILHEGESVSRDYLLSCVLSLS